MPAPVNTISPGVLSSTDEIYTTGTVSRLEGLLSLITSYHRGKARFVATVSASVAPFVAVRGAVEAIPEAFDLDSATSAQLDVDGVWIGRSRFVPVPLPNLFFSFGKASLGFGYGYWKGPYDAADGISRLPDAVYRQLLRAKVLANRWDGTTERAETILATYFNDPATKVFIDDRALAAQPVAYFTLGDANRGFGQGVWYRRWFALGDPASGFGQGSWRSRLEGYEPPTNLGLEMIVGIAGKIPAAIDLSVLGHDLIPIKPMGARVSYAVTTVDGLALFGFGAQNDQIAGFGTGAWGNTPDFVAALAA